MATRQQPDTRCDVVFRGRVQGVGFRGAVMGAVSRYPIIGYVANTETGEVHMVAEGTREHVSSLIQIVLQTMDGFVTGHSENWTVGTGEFLDFRIRRNEP